VITRKKLPAQSFDVVIVGAGISGALMADALAGHGLSIVVIDRRMPVRGSSIASTAMIQHEIDVPLHQLCGMIGRRSAERVWQRSAQAVENLATRVDELDIDCQFERKKTLFLSGSEYGSRALKAEFEAREHAGLQVSLCDAEAVRAEFDIERSAALVSDISASANPGQLTAGILRSTRKRGVEIVSELEVTDVREIGDRVVLATSSGTIIDAAHAVFCTGYEFLEGIASDGNNIASTWAIASKPGLERPKWLDDYLVWEGADPYLYFRSAPDGRLIAGGEDEGDPEAYLSPGKLASKAKTIVEKIGDLTGIKVGTPDHVWSAAFGLTSTGLPMIGKVPGHARTFSAMGFGGNGITFSKIAAEIISGDILGKPDPDRLLFPFAGGKAKAL
jgi:glycine/D-amino acid oxidase-like deaminating enzyme